MPDLSDKPPLDWRYRTATTLSEPWVSPFTDNAYPPGTPVSKSTFIRRGENRLKIGDPSAPALYLNLARRSHEHALDNHPLSDEAELPKGVDPSRIAYDYLENIMSSITFSFAAIEAWANEEIPGDYKYEYERASGILVSESKETIERKINLSEKIGTILPEVMGIESPRGTTVWEQFVELRRIRNSIVHLKTRDRATSNEQELYPDSIWSKLLYPEQPNYPLHAKQLITHFVSPERYHWLKYCPID